MAAWHRALAVRSAPSPLVSSPENEHEDASAHRSGLRWGWSASARGAWHSSHARGYPDFHNVKSSRWSTEGERRTEGQLREPVQPHSDSDSPGSPNTPLTLVQVGVPPPRPKEPHQKEKQIKRQSRILQTQQRHPRCPSPAWDIPRRDPEESKHTNRASLVAQWLRICLPMQGTRVRALVREDPTCRGATRPVSHNY